MKLRISFYVAGHPLCFYTTWVNFGRKHSDQFPAALPPKADIIPHCIKSGLQPIEPMQGRIRSRMPIVPPLSASGRNHLGNPG